MTPDLEAIKARQTARLAECKFVHQGDETADIEELLNHIAALEERDDAMNDLAYAHGMSAAECILAPHIVDSDDARAARAKIGELAGKWQRPAIAALRALKEG